MLKFICLGSGSSGNGYFLWTDTDAIMIDAGIGIKLLKRYIQTYDLPWERMRAVLITHDHADHIKSIGKLAAEYSLPVYSTELVHQGIARNYCVSPNLKTEYQYHLEIDKLLQLGDFAVTAFSVPHDSTECVGFRVEAQGVRFCLITDIGHVTERVKEEVSLANYLVLESNHDQEMLMSGPYPAYLKGRIAGPTGHLSNREAAELLANSSSPALRHVWLCHLSEENNHPELARKTVDSILRSYGIIPNVDFHLDVLRRKVPSEIYDLTPSEE
ncbi:MAG: MBL fold metallo-hydrolase [Bacteroidaceae bacterium]|nr:MBL fold metallo-hydrolase [Bacteroidaceae bacterium]